MRKQKSFSLNQTIKNFSLNWFTINMGTGITAVCLSLFHHLIHFTFYLSVAIWLLNIFLFIFFSLILISRSFLIVDTWRVWLSHPVQSLFFGCIPIGLITIVNGFSIWGTGLIGGIAIDIAAVLWWLAVILSLLSVLLIPYCMVTRHQHVMANMTALWLLPFVACEVCAASAGMLIPHLSLMHAYLIFLLSLCLWTVSIFLVLSILVIYLQRLFLHKMPAVELAATIWLPLGPTAMAALGILLLGSEMTNFESLITTRSMQDLFHMFGGLSLFLGIICWALATWWFVMAVIGTISYLKQKPRFSLGFWAYIFPLGVYTMASAILAERLKLTALLYFSYFLALTLFAIWLVIGAKTLLKAYRHANADDDEILRKVA